MILKQEFYHMVNKMGLEDSDLTIAEIVWEKAERAMQGKPVQEAALLKNAAFKSIARKILGITTLESRNSDSLDFYDLSVGSLERALLAAYEAGRKSQVGGEGK